MHVADCPLTSLPDELAQLPALRVLAIGSTKIARIPEVIGKLPQLRELHAGHLPQGADVQALAGVPQLEVLDLSYLRPEGEGVRPFPDVILTLRKLRSLDLSYTALSGIPDTIVESILAENPGFQDFQDLKQAPAYLEWLRTRQRG